MPSLSSVRLELGTQLRLVRLMYRFSSGLRIHHGGCEPDAVFLGHRSAHLQILLGGLDDGFPHYLGTVLDQPEGELELARRVPEQGRPQLFQIFSHWTPPPPARGQRLLLHRLQSEPAYPRATSVSKVPPHRRIRIRGRQIPPS